MAGLRKKAMSQGLPVLAALLAAAVVTAPSKGATAQTTTSQSVPAFDREVIAVAGVLRELAAMHNAQARYVLPLHSNEELEAIGVLCERFESSHIPHSDVPAACLDLAIDGRGASHPHAF